MHLHVFVGTVAEEFPAAGPEVGEPGDVLLGSQAGCLMEMDCGHVLLLSLAGNHLLAAVDVKDYSREWLFWSLLLPSKLATAF
jgi:hypothetical protein